MTTKNDVAQVREAISRGACGLNEEPWETRAVEALVRLAATAERADEAERAYDTAERAAVMWMERAERAEAALLAAQQERGLYRHDVLAPHEVCGCLDETGKRTVRLYERCLRCGCFTESDYAERAEAAITRLREALEFYADEYTQTRSRKPHTGWVEDNGAIARAALALAEQANA